MNGLLQSGPREAEPRPDKEPHLHGRSGLAGAGQAGRRPRAARATLSVAACRGKVKGG